MLNTREKRLLIIALIAVLGFNIAIQVFPSGLGTFSTPVKGFLPDSDLYLKTTQFLAGEQIDTGGDVNFPLLGKVYKIPFALQRINRILYPLLTIPFYILTRSPMSMLVMPALTGALGVIVVYKVLKTAGLEKRYALLGSIVMLFSKMYAFLSAIVYTDMIAFFFGWLFVLYWLKNDRGKKNGITTGIAGALAIAARETNLGLILAAAITDFHHNQLKDKSWWKLPAAIAIISIPIFAALVSYAWLEYPKLAPNPEDDIYVTPFTFFDQLYGADGLLILFALLGLSYFYKHRKNKTMEFFAWTIFFNILTQLAWPTTHRRYWLTSLPAVIYFGQLWFERRATFRDAFIASTFVLIADTEYSVLPTTLSMVSSLIGKLF